MHALTQRCAVYMCDVCRCCLICFPASLVLSIYHGQLVVCFCFGTVGFFITPSRVEMLEKLL